MVALWITNGPVSFTMDSTLASEQHNVAEESISFAISMYTAPISALRTATNDLMIHTEVQSLLQSMLDDVETAHSLNEKLTHVYQISDLEHDLQVTQAELDERRAYDAIKTQELHHMGDVMAGLTDPSSPTFLAHSGAPLRSSDR